MWQACAGYSTGWVRRGLDGAKPLICTPPLMLALRRRLLTTFIRAKTGLLVAIPGCAARIFLGQANYLEWQCKPQAFGTRTGSSVSPK